MKKAASIKDLFLVKIKALYDIESELIKALPKMAKKATNPELKKGLEDHLKETKNQAGRLEQIFASLGLKPQKTKVEAIRGLTKDAAWVMQNVQPGPALDANLIAAGQHVEHFEMAGYGTAIEWAKLLGLQNAESLLEETLSEEKAADEKLNELAISGINSQALPVEE